MEKEILVLSDIHGRGNELKVIVRKILNRLDNFKIILMGDYIGYGNNNIEVVKMLKFLEENAECIFLKGNWEDMLYTYIKNKSSQDEWDKSKIRSFQNRGGIHTLNQFSKNKQALDYFINLIEKMSLIHTEMINKEAYVFAHSGINLFVEDSMDLGVTLCINNYDNDDNIFDDDDIFDDDFSQDLFNFEENEDNKNYLMELSEYETIISNQTPMDLMWNFNFYSDIEQYSYILEGLPFKIVAGHTPTYILNKNNPFEVYNFENKILGVDFGASSKKGKIGLVNLSKPRYPTLFQDIIK